LRFLPAEPKQEGKLAARMLLIIDNKDDPTNPIAEETDGSPELVYIPVVTAPVENDAQQTSRKLVLDRMCYEFRKGETGESPSPQRAEKLVPLFLKALGRTGRRPEYLSASAGNVFGTEPEENRARLYVRG
jgi:hypothetical protein